MAAVAGAVDASNATDMQVSTHFDNLAGAARNRAARYRRLIDSQTSLTSLDTRVCEVYRLYIDYHGENSPESIASELYTHADDIMEKMKLKKINVRPLTGTLELGEKRRDDISDLDLPEQSVEKVYALIRLLAPVFYKAIESDIESNSPFLTVLRSNKSDP